MKKCSSLSSILILVLFALQLMAKEPFVKPKKLSVSNFPSVERYILDQVKMGEEIEAVSVESAGLYELSANCQGNKLYGLTFHELKVKNKAGELEDVSALFTGSGGTTVVVFTVSKDGKTINELFSSVLLDFYGATSKADCPALSVQVRDIGKKGVMEVRSARLKFESGKYVVEK